MTMTPSPEVVTWLDHYPIEMRTAALGHWAAIIAAARASEADAAARAVRNRRVERWKFRRLWRGYPVAFTKHQE